MIKELVTKGKYLMRLMEKLLVCTAFIATMATNAQAQMKTYSGRYAPQKTEEADAVSGKEIFDIDRLEIIHNQNRGDIDKMIIDAHQPVQGTSYNKTIHIELATDRNGSVLLPGNNSAIFFKKLAIRGDENNNTAEADVDFSIKVSGNYHGDDKNVVDIVPIIDPRIQNSEPEHSLKEIEFVGTTSSIVIRDEQNNRMTTVASDVVNDARVYGLLIARNKFDIQQRIGYERYKVYPSYQKRQNGPRHY